jgi:hypothetical protein
MHSASSYESADILRGSRQSKAYTCALLLIQVQTEVYIFDVRE